MCYSHIVNFLSGRASTAAYHPLLPLHRDAEKDGGPGVDAVAGQDFLSFLWNLRLSVLGALCIFRGRRKVQDPSIPSTSIPIEGAHRRLLSSERGTSSFDAVSPNFQLDFKRHKTLDEVLLQSDPCDPTLDELAPGYPLSSPSSSTVDDTYAGRPENVLIHRGAAFILRARIGDGAMGHVILGAAVFPGVRTEQNVAIKVISKRQAVLRRARKIQSDSSMTMVATPARITLEVETLKRFVESPFLTPLLAAFQDEANVYLVMRMYPETLATRIQGSAEEKKKLGIDEIRLYGAEIALHQVYHTIHCDLKPENILISPAGHLCIADFGLSKQPTRVGKDAIAMRALVKSCKVGTAGTPSYQAPEMFRPRRSSFHGPPVDIWAVCRTLTTHRRASGIARSLAVPKVYELVEEFDAAHLIDAIVNRDPMARLRLQEIRSHPFFFAIDWGRVERRGYAPSYQPMLSVGGYSSVVETEVLSAKDMKNAVELVFGSLEVDYMCPAGVIVDALH
ncbi:kinase-like domain-containing protein [Mycena vulgaris]|nr:kinase-like domain-containing protein [Mycena vulgaris]